MLNRLKSLIILAYKMLVYALCMLVFFLIMGREIAYLLNFSRTMIIVGVSFTFSYIMLAKIYGGMDIGTRKSKSIIFSMLLILFFTDLIAHLFLCIMDYTIVHDYHFVYERPDLLLLIYVVQVLISMAAAFAGNELFFTVFKPQRCILVYNPYSDVDSFAEKVKKYKKQYRIKAAYAFDSMYVDQVYAAVDKADAVFIYGLSAAERSGIVNYCYGANKDIYYDLEMSDIVASGGTMVSFEDSPVIFSPAKNNNMLYRLVKRLSDIFLSVLGLIILSPLFLIVSIAIRMEDGQPVFYRQERITIAGQKFKVIKFRSMRNEVGDVHESVTQDDDRITKVGRVIRKFRIDEFPQLINVIKGDMSLVGPRPEMVENVAKYTDELPEFAFRHRMKAGITGMAQVYGKYNTSPKDKLVYDLMYIENLSIWLDIKILLRTVLVLFTPSESTEAFERKESKNDE